MPGDGKGDEILQHGLRAIGVDLSHRRISTNDLSDFNVDQVRNKEGLITPGEFVSDGICQRAVGEQFLPPKHPERSSLFSPLPNYLRSSTPGWKRLRLLRTLQLPLIEIGKVHAFARRP